MTAALSPLVAALDVHLSGWRKDGPTQTRTYDPEPCQSTQVSWHAGSQAVYYSQTHSGGWLVHVRADGGEVYTSSDVATPDSAAGLIRLVLGGDP